MKALLVIDMPKHCLDCPCYNARNLFCQATLETYYNETGDRPEWCRLRPIHEGDLDMIIQFVEARKYLEESIPNIKVRMIDRTDGTG